MALTVLAPRPRGTGSEYADRKPRTVLRLVPDLSSGGQVDRKAFVIFLSLVGVVGLLLLLTINTMLAQDAFELRRLQAQATTLSDQREAVMRKIATASSPEVLALRATAAGMVPSLSPRFLSLVPTELSSVGAKG
ncbi:MAG: hypothetical protein Q8L08_04255 [Candidatus Nanopelagicaceae bacterium]|nr:hypothetical protein [Candidatus Nanopelagicaceae bacterium]